MTADTRVFGATRQEREFTRSSAVLPAGGKGSVSCARCATVVTFERNRSKNVGHKRALISKVRRETYNELVKLGRLTLLRKKTRGKALKD